MQIKTINKNANMSIKVKCKFVSCFECSQKKKKCNGTKRKPNPWGGDRRKTFAENAVKTQSD